MVDDAPHPPPSSLNLGASNPLFLASDKTPVPNKKTRPMITKSSTTATCWA